LAFLGGFCRGRNHRAEGQSPFALKFPSPAPHPPLLSTPSQHLRRRIPNGAGSSGQNPAASEARWRWELSRLSVGRAKTQPPAKRGGGGSCRDCWWDEPKPSRQRSAVAVGAVETVGGTSQNPAASEARWRWELSRLLAGRAKTQPPAKRGGGGSCRDCWWDEPRPPPISAERRCSG
jgi:hypothetical protein